MRIHSGTLKGRRVISPPDESTTRPIPDRVKSSVFQILRGHFEGEAVFDGFAGTGAIGLEAASLGASRVVMVERDKRVAMVCEKNVETLGVGDRCEVVRGDALGPIALARCPDPVHIVFLDPPYAMVEDPEGWARVRAQFERLIGKLDETGFAILRTPAPFRFERPRVEATEPDIPDTNVEVVDLDDPDADDKLEAFEREFGLNDPAFDAKPDLTFANAVGPETHVYRKTAVHLYMRKPADS